MDYEQLILVFASIIYEALPFIVLGVIIAGILEEFVPQQAIAKVIPGYRPLAIGMGGLLGLVFPMCECGIIVVMRRLLRKGLPLSVCVAYMLAGPIINAVVMISTYVAFNPPDARYYIFGGPEGVVMIRVGMGFLVAVVTALIVEWQSRNHSNELLAAVVMRGLSQDEEAGNNGGRRSWMQRLNNITETALHDFIDIMAFLILGASLAAAGRAVLGANPERTVGQQQQEDTAKPKGDAAGPSAANGEKGNAPKGEAAKDAKVEPAKKEAAATRLIRETPPLAIALMMGIAILFCLCSEADAFVAANFQTFWPPASKMAFLVLGPMMDIKLLLMYTRIFRPRLILTITVAVASQVFLYSLLLHYLPPILGM